MSAQFNDKAINTVFDKVLSYALASGRFESVNQHEPRSKPKNGISGALWAQSIRPIRSSGLAATSGVVTFFFRIYTRFNAEPIDMIDPEVMSATSDLMGALSADFDFGGDADVRNVDLLGSQGTPLSAQAGYMDIDRTMFRVMTITIPVIINDMFVQTA